MYSFVSVLALFLVGCGGNTPVDTATCSSGLLYAGSSGVGDGVGDTQPVVDDGDEGDATMNPGQNCISCHAGNEAPDYTIAGTVMGASGDVDDCLGVSGVVVTITDADGVVTTLTSNSNGNFYSAVNFAAPYTVELDNGGVTSVMNAAQTDGNCATCHTDVGAGGAPGRVVAP